MCLNANDAEKQNRNQMYLSLILHITYDLKHKLELE